LISFVTSYRAFFPTVAPRASSFAAARVDRIIATPIGLLGDGAGSRSAFVRRRRVRDDAMRFATDDDATLVSDARRDPALDRRVDE
jgi:hypothetical protein